MTANGWPIEPGVPESPEQNGAHQLTHAVPNPPIRGPWVLLWCAPERLWTDLFGNREPPEAMAQHRYIGRMLPPLHPDTVDPTTLVSRLRGVYRIPIRDGLGPVGAGDEPDNPGAYVSSHQTPPIQRAAADRIEALEAVVSAPSTIRALYREACHAAGAPPRWAARDRLDAIAQATGKPLGAILEGQGLDLGAYFASRPISRPAGEG